MRRGCCALVEFPFGETVFYDALVAIEMSRWSSSNGRLRNLGKAQSQEPFIGKQLLVEAELAVAQHDYHSCLAKVHLRHFGLSRERGLFLWQRRHWSVSELQNTACAGQPGCSVVFLDEALVLYEKWCGCNTQK